MSERIALFCASLDGGGAQRVVLNLARGFAERGFIVDLVLARAQGPFLKEVHPDVTIIDLRARRVLTSLPGLVRYLRRHRPAAVLSAMDHVNVVAVLAVKLAGVKTRLVASVHNFRTSQSLSTLREHIIHRVLLRKVYPWMDMVVAVSEGVKEQLALNTGMSSERIRVVYNPVVTPELFEKAKLHVQHPWFARAEPPIILGVGRLNKQKDLFTLIQAFRVARRKRPVKLMILGEGSERAELEALVSTLKLESDIALPGFVDNPYAYMAGASVFVLSSAWEGFGNVLVEAMAVGCPVVSTECQSGPAEILDHGRYGRLVSVGDAEALASAILATLEAPVDAKVLRARADMFSLKNIADQYLNVLLGEAVDREVRLKPAIRGST